MHGTFTSCMFLEDSMKIKYILSNRKKTLPNVAEQHQGTLTLLDISSQYLKNKQAKHPTSRHTKIKIQLY